MTTPRGMPAMGLTRLELAAGAAALLWLALGIMRLWLLPTGLGPGAVVVEGVGATLPVVLLVVLLGARRRIAALEAELDAARRGLRAASAGGAGATGVVMVSPAVPQAMAQAAPAAHTSAQTTVRPTAGAARRPPAPAPVRDPVPAATQPEFQLSSDPDDTPMPAVPLTREDALRALDFPDTPEDAAGRAALLRGLDDPWFARILRSGQDVLVLLAQEGLAGQFLPAGDANADLWRRFAAGERGEALAPICGADPLVTAMLSERMRRDEVFRDASHHYLRRFDTFLGAFVQDATDAELSALSQSRSARAFAVLAAAVGALG